MLRLKVNSYSKEFYEESGRKNLAGISIRTKIYFGLLDGRLGQHFYR